MPERELEYLQKQARRCRSAASATFDVQARQTLLEMADEYERRSEALESEERRATNMRWGKAYEGVPDPVRESDALACDQLERAGRAGSKPGGEELRRRCEQHGIDQAKVRILQRVARGLPINVLERRLIEGDCRQVSKLH